MQTKTVFLSHSSKDIDRVRKIRNILETLEYEPLLFHMKCLDDDNDVLEDFICKEIDARNIFVYCKSINAEQSQWVRKEVEYIKKTNNKRLYEIDIDKPFSATLVSLLITLADIIKQNKIFISCSHADKKYSKAISDLLIQNDYDVIKYDFLQEDDKEYLSDINETVKNGIFMPIITRNYLNSIYCKSEIERAQYLYESGYKVIFRPICVGVSSSIVQQLFPRFVCDFNFYSVNSIDDINLATLLKFVAEGI